MSASVSFSTLLDVRLSASKAFAASVAVHDHRNVPRQPAQIPLFQQECFLGRDGAERMRSGDVQRLAGFGVTHRLNIRSLLYPTKLARLLQPPQRGYLVRFTEGT